MFGMKPSDAQLLEWVKSYGETQVDMGGTISSVCRHEKTHSLFVATDKGLLKMNGITNKITPSKITEKIKKMISSDDGAYCVTERDEVFSWNQNDDSLKLVYKGPMSDLVYSSESKILYGMAGNEIIEIDTVTGANKFFPYDLVSALCCGPDNSLYIGSLGGLKKQGATGDKLGFRNINNKVVTLIKRDLITGSVYFSCGSDGVIAKSNTDLENGTLIQYADIFSNRSTITFECDYISKLLCILSYGKDKVYRVHLTPPDNIGIRNDTVPFLRFGNMKNIACDSLTNTFYIAGQDTINVLKPKSSYLALVNASAFTVFKMLLHMNNQAALEEELL